MLEYIMLLYSKFYSQISGGNIYIYIYLNKINFNNNNNIIKIKEIL